LSFDLYSVEIFFTLDRTRSSVAASRREKKPVPGREMPGSHEHLSTKPRCCEQMTGRVRCAGAWTGNQHRRSRTPEKLKPPTARSRASWTDRGRTTLRHHPIAISPRS